MGRVTLVFITVLAGALAFAASAAAVRPSFGAVNTITTGGNVYGLDIGDVNKDGKADIVAANDSSSGPTTSGHVSVLLGKGDGQFKPEVKLHDPRGPEGVAIADFNGDGRKDIAVANYNNFVQTGGKASVEIFLAKKGGGFKDTGRVPVANGSWVIQAADLNRDGNVDIVTGSYDSTGPKAVSVLLGKGDGTFRRAQNYTVDVGNMAGIAVGRMNGDKRPDVVTANYADGVCVLLTEADGKLKAPKCKADPGSGQSNDNVALGDFNADGKLDVALADYSGDQVIIWLGKGRGGLFGPVTSSAGGLQPNGIVAGRFNGGKRLDVATANFASPYGAGVYPGTGTGQFRPPTAFDGGDVAESIEAGSLNGDKATDLAVGTNTGVDVFLNQL